MCGTWLPLNCRFLFYAASCLNDWQLDIVAEWITHRPTGRLAAWFMGACPGQPCFGAQLKRNQSQKSPSDMGSPRSPSSSCDGLTHLPGQHLPPGDNPHGKVFCSKAGLSYKSSIINAKCGLTLHRWTPMRDSRISCTRRKRGYAIYRWEYWRNSV